MKIFSVTSVVAVAVLLVGCGTLESKSSLVDVGADKKEVLQVMGSPDERQVKGDKEAWQYCISGAGFGYNDHRIVWFSKGIVTGITPYKTHQTGCVGNIRPVVWENAPTTVVEIRNR
jgi:hypothetical protein